MDKTSRARPVKNLLPEFDRLHRAYVGVPAIFRRGKDAALIADIVRSQGEAGTLALMQAYFTSDDPFIRANGYGIGVFVSQASKLLAHGQRIVRHADEADWREECARVHDSRCTNPYFHRAWMEATAEQKTKGVR
jgi:hypothetical protein